MPDVAADLLEAGYDSPSLRRLAGETQIRCTADAEPLVASTFHELGVRYPLAVEQAELITIRRIAREVIAGRRNPWAAARHIEIAICGWTSENDEVQAIFAITDELSWSTSDRRSAASLTNDLLDRFARIASLDLKNLCD